MTGRRLALFIDCDNIPSEYVEEMFDKAKQYGEFMFKRAYGDWTSNRIKSWVAKCKKFAITPIQQFNIKGKNSTDMALVINAMDILHMHAGYTLDGFCICSSDSDYIPLVTRAKEDGLFVIGFGIKKISSSEIANFYDHFIYLADTQKANSSPKNGIDTEIQRKLKEAYDKISEKQSDKSKGISLASLGSVLISMDVNYKALGFPQLNKFISSSELFTIKGEGTQMRALLKV